MCIYMDIDLWIFAYRNYIPYTYMCLHIRTLKLCIPCSKITPLTSRTHAHLIGVSRIGASLQHGAQTGHESEACKIKQERVLVVVCDVGALKVLRKRCLHFVGFGEDKRRFAVLSGKGRRQCVRGVGVSASSLSSARIQS